MAQQIIIQKMDIRTFLIDWITASNAFDTKRYLSFYLENAILDDPSVGKIFKGHKGMQDYFESYFIGYNTSMELVALTISDDGTAAHLKVTFRGDFPEGIIGGIFDFQFREEKIAFIKADLLH